MAWFSNQGFAGTIDFSINPTTGAYGNSNVTAGPGITVSGNTITNDGIRSIIAGGGLQIGGDVAHNPTISLTAAATGVEQCIAGTGIGITGDPALPLITNTGVLSVTGTGVDNTDPQNPVLTVVESLTAGTNVTITGTASNPIISATGGGGGGPTSDLFTIVDVDVTAADLAGGATKTIWTPPDASTYIVLQCAKVVDQCVDFDAGGDRDISVQFAPIDGDLPQNLVEPVLKNLSLSGLNLQSFESGLDPNTINQPNNVIRAVYSSGTTDYTSGSIHLRYWILNTNATAIGGGDNIVYVKDVSITAAALAGGGQVTILNNTDPAGQYEVIAAYSSAFGATIFDAGLDRQVLITDGTSEYGKFTDNVLRNELQNRTLPYNSSSSDDGILLPIANSISVPTAAGANLYAEYIGGTTDAISGEIILSMVLRKIAGNNSVGVQQVVAGTGVTVDNTNPQYPIVSANAAVANTATLKDNGNAGEVFYLCNRSAGFGLYKSVIKPFLFNDTSSPLSASDAHVVYNVCVDSSDNIYITGKFFGTLTLGAHTVTSNDPAYEDVFVAKMLANGTWSWIKTGFFNAYGSDIVTDNTHVYVSVFFIDQLSFDGNVTTSTGYNVGILKLTTSGTYVDLYHSTQSNGEGPLPYNLKLLSGGDVVVGFILGNTTAVSFGATTITSAAQDRIGVARLNTGAGTWTWATVNTFTGTAAMAFEGYEFGSLAVDASDNIYLAASMIASTGATVTLGSTITNIGGEDKLIVAKMNSSGVWQWALSDEAITSNTTRGHAVVVDGSTVYVSGNGLTGSVFGSTTLAADAILIATCTTAGAWNSVIFKIETTLGAFTRLYIHNGELYAAYSQIPDSMPTGVPYILLKSGAGLLKLDLSGTPLSVFGRGYLNNIFVHAAFNSADEVYVVGQSDQDQVQFQPPINGGGRFLFIYRLKANLDLYTTPCYYCVLLQSGTAGDEVEFAILNAQNVFSGLTPGTIYSWDVDSETIAILPTYGLESNLGIAMSPTKLLLSFPPGSTYIDTWNPNA